MMNAAASCALNGPTSLTPISGEWQIPIVGVRDLHQKFGFPHPLAYPETSLRKPLTQWRMEDDDAPIFRYLYRHFRPRRTDRGGDIDALGDHRSRHHADAQPAGAVECLKDRGPRIGLDRGIHDPHFMSAGHQRGREMDQGGAQPRHRDQARCGRRSAGSALMIAAMNASDTSTRMKAIAEPVPKFIIEKLSCQIRKESSVVAVPGPPAVIA